MQYIEKHVEFTNGLDEENTTDHQHQQKLHRRDTPHHLKNKRVLNKNNDSLTFDVKISFFLRITLFDCFVLANYVT